ncbi:MAG: SulP family inorganic anion transporter [Planctomycetaceae bacterium]
MSEQTNPIATIDNSDKPIGNATGFTRFFRNDITSGFLVFLIALPLCLGISLACGYPAIAGVFTAIIGGILTTFISNSELTIKGPAAGLIVIVVGCVESFGGDGAIGGFSDIDMQAYKMALAVGVAAAVLQILFGLFRAGALGEFFPLSAVHGMLAAIGVIIMVKQIPVALGVQARGEPMEMIRQIPQYFREMNPEIALIGFIGVLIMFLWPLVQKKVPALKAVPAALIVLTVAVPMGMFFNLMQEHTYSFFGHEYKLSESYLVRMPDRPFGMFDNIAYPDFSVLTGGEHVATAWKWVFMFFIIGSLESILSAKAIDVIDPWKRKTNLNRDIAAVGVANLCASLVGGLPMISEIVRSKANIDNGARTRFADMWHGLFLLLCVALIPTLLHRIPLAALAAMLIFTGFRLTHPREFLHVYRIGPEQLLIFVATLVGVLATDLLVGIIIGIGVEAALHLINGVPFRSLFKPDLDIDMEDEKTALVRAKYSAVFSNWISLRRQLVRLGIQEGLNVTLDLSDTKVVDHSVMEKLHELQTDFENAGTELQVIGLDGHIQFSEHPLSSRKRGRKRLRRITVVAGHDMEGDICTKLVEFGASGYTVIPCTGAGRTVLKSVEGSGPSNGNGRHVDQVRVEALLPAAAANRVLEYLRTDVCRKHAVTACLETVEVVRTEL